MNGGHGPMGISGGPPRAEPDRGKNAAPTQAPLPQAPAPTAYTRRSISSTTNLLPK